MTWFTILKGSKWNVSVDKESDTNAEPIRLSNEGNNITIHYNPENPYFECLCEEIGDSK